MFTWKKEAGETRKRTPHSSSSSHGSPSSASTAPDAALAPALKSRCRSEEGKVMAGVTEEVMEEDVLEEVVPRMGGQGGMGW